MKLNWIKIIAYFLTFVLGLVFWLIIYTLISDI